MQVLLVTLYEEYTLLFSYGSWLSLMSMALRESSSEDVRQDLDKYSFGVVLY